MTSAPCSRIAVLATARITAFRPGQSPPPVRTATRLDIVFLLQHELDAPAHIVRPSFFRHGPGSHQRRTTCHPVHVSSPDLEAVLDRAGRDVPDVSGVFLNCPV